MPCTSLAARSPLLLTLPVQGSFTSLPSSTLLASPLLSSPPLSSPPLLASPLPLPTASFLLTPCSLLLRPPLFLSPYPPPSRTPFVDELGLPLGAEKERQGLRKRPPPRPGLFGSSSSDRLVNLRRSGRLGSSAFLLPYSSPPLLPSLISYSFLRLYVPP